MAVYANYGAILPEFISVGLARRLFTEVKKEHRKRGYKIVYFTSTSPHILGLGQKMGAKIVKERKCEDPEFQGETYALVKGVYIYKTNTEVKKEEIKPKL